MMKFSQRIKTACVLCISHVAAKANGAAVDEYTFFGNGQYRGSDNSGAAGKHFPFFFLHISQTSMSVWEANACADLCIQYTPSDALQYHTGFTYDPNLNGSCRCAFVDGYLPIIGQGGIQQLVNVPDVTATCCITDQIWEPTAGYVSYLYNVRSVGVISSMF